MADPPSPLRIHPADVALAERAARAGGMTRLADITRLDRIGVPVFQAIRPLSRALAVHQGKGLCPNAARLGACMEAVECARAEVWSESWGVSSWTDLPAALRPADLSDFADRRDDPPSPDAPRPWTEVRRLLDDRKMLVPLDCISLDFIRPWDRLLDHTSIGLGAHFDLEAAYRKALLEVVEHDARAAWGRLPRLARAETALDLDSIPLGWFRNVREQIRSSGLRLSVFQLPVLAGLAGFYAEIADARAAPGASVCAAGWSCDPHTEDALRGAVLEAAQSRLTGIAAARDDILHGQSRGVSIGAAAPLPPGRRGRPWPRPAEAAEEERLTPERLAARLARAGYPDAAVVALGPARDWVWVVKAFVPGLATETRGRRAPLGSRDP